MRRRYLVFMFVISFLFLLSSCNNGIHEYTNIENENSVLLGFLVTRTDLDGGWRWENNITTQAAMTSDTQSGLEYANRELVGVYQKNLIIIEHEVYCYDDNHPVNVVKRDYENGDLNAREFALNDSDYIFYAQCRDFSDTLHKCHVLSIYENVVSDIEIRGPKEVDYSVFIEMLNSLVPITDDRVGEKPTCVQ